MVHWDWLSQEAGTAPEWFHAATEILKVMESLTAVGSAALSRLLTVSPAPLTACPRWDDAAGTDGHLAADPLMKHTLFFSLSLSLLITSRFSSSFSNASLASVTHLAGQHANHCEQPHMTIFMRSHVFLLAVMTV